MKPVRTGKAPGRDPRELTREDYLDFGRRADDSPCLSEWAFAVADDPEVLALLGELPPDKQQPNLEVGASAGLCLYSDRYSYRYTGEVEAALDPPEGRSPVVLECRTEGAPPVPAAMPEVVWRGGIDLRPLDIRDDESVRWLEHLVWPEHEDRRARLAAAVQLARADPPALVHGDLVEALPELAAQAPPDATLVVFHSAVLAYLSEADRQEFTTMVRGLDAHWVSNEGPTVLPEMASTAAEPPDGSAVGPSPFLLALDGRAVAWTHSHGRALSWIEPEPSA